MLALILKRGFGTIMVSQTCLKQDLEFASKLYTLPRVTSTRIARALGTNVTRIKKLFTLLNFYGVKMQIDVAHSRMGLKLVSILIRGVKVNKPLDIVASSIPFVKGLAIVVPRSLLIVLQLPSAINVDMTSHDGSSLWSFDFVIRSKPLPHLLELCITGLHRTLVDQLPKAFEHKYEVPIEELLSPARFDGTDLEILYRLQLHPHLTLRELARELGSRPSKIERHIVDHVEKLVIGYRISRITAIENPVVRHIVFKCKDAYDVCLRLVSHPYVLSCTASHNGHVAVLVRAPPPHTMMFIEKLISILESYNCCLEDCFEYCLSKSLFVSTTIPRRGFEYVPTLRSWSKDLDTESIVKSIVRMLMS